MKTNKEIAENLLGIVKDNQKSLQEQLEHYTQITFENERNFIEEFGSGVKGRLRRFGMGRLEVYFDVKRALCESKHTILLSSFIKWADNVEPIRGPQE